MYRLTVFVTFALLMSSPTAWAHDPLQRNGHHHAATPAAPPGVADLARLNILAFRESGHDVHLDRAAALLDEALDERPADRELLVLAASVAQSRHDFDQSLALLDDALALDPHNDEAWLLRASVALVKNDLTAAKNACRRLRKTDPLVIVTCQARVAQAEGESLVAARRLTGLLERMDVTRVSTEQYAWALSVAGDLLRDSEQPAAARDYYGRSLGQVDRTQVRAALVDVLIEQRDYDRARQVLGMRDALPLLVRRLIVLRALGEMEDSDALLAGLDREFQAWIADRDWAHAREMARFYLDVLPRQDTARKLAQINYTLQKEPEDLRLLRRTVPAS